ncbi:hypothetical protein [Jiangella anatolica]|uniref:hypothetical protein n=1 Tax=Jiangella anatolica TaxID=2670374 RepID=UPI0018F2CEC9|nr:hypothetical protein [Jiangella anatolica]
MRKLVLTAHVTSSLGWLGAVAVFLALAIVALTSDNASTVRGAYLAMEPAARLTLVPLSLLALLTGVIQSLGTSWGLLRHYWVIFKLLINVIASIYLLLYLPSFEQFAATAADDSADLDSVRNISPALHAVLALLLLLVAAVLAVYKPRGVTPYGERRRLERRQQRTEPRARTATTPSARRAE